MASETTKKKAAGSKSAASRSNTNTKNKENNKKNSANSSRKKTNTAAVSTSRQMHIQDLPPVQEHTNPVLLKETVMWLIIAVSVLLYISYFGIGGYLGAVCADLSFGIWGIGAWIFPILLFFSSAFLISNKGSRLASIKFSFVIVLYVCICSFASLFTGEYEEASTVWGLYERSAAYHNGGGFVGGGICQLLAPALGAVGTGIILFVLVIISVVMITQKSVMGGMKHHGEKVYRSARESSARRREAYQQERQRREDWKRLEEGETQQIPVHVERVERVTPQRKREMSAINVKNEVSQSQVSHTLSSIEPVRPVSKSGRTEIEVPVMFPVNRRESRVEHRVSGVTMDTRISGNPEMIGTEVHQISAGIPNVQEQQHKIQREEEVQKQPENIGTSYIDLEYEAEEPEMVFKIEGISKEETPVTAVEEHFEDISFEDVGCEENDGEDEMEDPVLADELQEEELDSAVIDVSEHEIPDMSETVKHPKLVRASDRIRTDDIFRSDIRSGAPSSAGTVFTQKPETVKPEEEPKAESQAPAKKNPRSSEKEIADGIASVQEEMDKAAEIVKPEYVFPPISLLKKGKGKTGGKNQEQEIRNTAAKLQQTLKTFGVNVTVTNVSCGPSVTRYELQPEMGVKVSRIVALADDIKLNLAAADIRIEAPIPGKPAVGIEVPNSENSAVALRDLIESEEFADHQSRIAFATGKDIAGKVVVSDIAKMPHLLIAGATGSGKSVCINTLIMSILYKAHPDDVKLIMIDPKVVELSVYNGIPHLFIPVVTDPKKAAGALNWAVAEMTDRYNKFAEYGVRDLKGYNQKIEGLADIDDPNKPKKLPQIVIIVDELADLMMVAPGEVEDAICRLAQLARACGIHLIIATQRPSVNVITGLIKANMPSRIAFSVSSGVDSRTILDMNGAEKLLGKGDMLFSPQGYPKPARVQGAFVSDEEVADVVDFLKNKNVNPTYSAEMEEQIAKVQQAVSAARNAEDADALFAEAGKFIIEKDKASIGMLQRVFKIGFNRAARIMDQLSDAGVVGPEEGTKPRRILMSAEQFENYLEENG